MKRQEYGEKNKKIEECRSMQAKESASESFLLRSRLSRSTRHFNQCVDLTLFFSFSFFCFRWILLAHTRRGNNFLSHKRASADDDDDDEDCVIEWTSSRVYQCTNVIEAIVQWQTVIIEDCLNDNLKNYNTNSTEQCPIVIAWFGK